MNYYNVEIGLGEHGDSAEDVFDVIKARLQRAGMPLGNQAVVYVWCENEDGKATESYEGVLNE